MIEIDKKIKESKFRETSSLEMETSFENGFVKTSNQSLHNRVTGMYSCQHIFDQKIQLFTRLRSFLRMNGLKIANTILKIYGCETTCIAFSLKGMAS